MRKAVQVFYTLFLLTFISQIYYGGTGSFLYEKDSHFVQSDKGKTQSVKSSSRVLDKLTNASKPNNSRTVIRAKALHENSPIDAFRPILLTLKYFSAYNLPVPNYTAYFGSRIHRTYLLRGPPQMSILA